MADLICLQEFDAMPVGLLELDARQLHTRLAGPSLIHLPGDQPQPIFVSCLLHGNEPTGWDAVRELLRGFAGRRLPRAMSILVGNVTAARSAQRRLPGQPDFNRVWPDAAGLPADDSPEAGIMSQVVKRMLGRGVLASVDIHNNTGANPHYGCLNELSPASRALAARFSPIALYFTFPAGVQSMAFIGRCPAITIECGQPGWAPGVQRASDFLKQCLSADFSVSARNDDAELTVYQSVAAVRFPADSHFGFGPADVGSEAFQLAPDLDHMNWCEVPAETRIGRFASASAPGPQVIDAYGNDTGERWLRRVGNQLVTSCALTPAMLTRDPEVIRNDCLCYILQKMPVTELGSAA